MIHYRPVVLPQDASALLTLDTGFTTDHVYDVVSEAYGFRLVEYPLARSITKKFPLDGELDEDRLWHYGVVAEDQHRIAGFAALRLETWKRRAAVWHLHVSPEYRRHGIARLLLQNLSDYARDHDMRWKPLT
jgi:ribosomal protein S18 acetylase RimI-like enzyme